jgi:hypothetical protein
LSAHRPLARKDLVAPQHATALTTAVDEWLPSRGDAEEPAWVIFVLPGIADAPVLSLARDPRAGPRLTPVFFVGVADQATLMPIGQSLYEGTGRLARIFHTVNLSETRALLVVPALYHLDDINAFSSAVEKYLTTLELGAITWYREHCEVLIAHGGVSYRAVQATDGTVEVVTTTES